MPLKLRLFFGLCNIRGFLKLTFHRVQHLFSFLYGNAVFSATMSLNRFKFLLAHFRFDNKAAREERWKQDRFGAMRDIFQIFTGNCERVLVPVDFLSLIRHCIQHVWGWDFFSTIRTNLQNMDYFFEV